MIANNIFKKINDNNLTNDYQQYLKKSMIYVNT